MTDEPTPAPPSTPEPPATPPTSPAPTPPPPAIVYLDVDDEITSAAARLRTMGAERIALVLPYGSRLVTSRINFRLLAREAGVSGKRLEIVAPDASARALAGSAGLAVHASVAALEAGHEPESHGVAAGSGAPDAAAAAAGALAAGAARGDTQVIPVPRTPDPIRTVGRRRTPITRRTAAILAVLIVALIAGGGLFAYAYLPSATIVLTPATERIGPLQLTVQARPDVTTPDLSSLTVPAQTFQFPVEANGQFTATGQNVTESKASGTVTFQNCDTGGGVKIPSGSRVSTSSGIGFLTLASVSLKRATIFPFTCKTASVAVQAQSPGTSGNVGAGAIDQIPPGYDSIVISVTNTQATTGGTHTATPEVTQTDVDAAMAQLNQQALVALDTKVRQEQGVPPGTITFPETESLGQTTPTVDPKTLVGQAVAQFDLGLTATGTALGADPAPITNLASQRLAAQVGDGWQLVDGSTSIQVGQPSASGTVATFPVTATATRVRVIDRDAVIGQIKGLVLDQARTVLAGYGSAEVSLWPDWVSAIPTNTDRISLTILVATPSSGPSSGPSPGVSPGPPSGQPAGS